MTTAVNRTAETVLPILLDPERSRAVEDTGLARGGDPTMDRLARLASALMDAPRAFVTLVTHERQHLPGMVRHDGPGTDERDQPLSASLCQFAVATEEPLVIPDSSKDPLVQHMAPVRNGEIGAYAGFPLRTHGGHVLGTLCVADGRSRPWESSRLTLLEDLTALAAQQLEQRLALARERRLRDLAQQLAGRVRPLTDAVHSLVDIAEDAEDAPLQRYAALTRSRMDPVASLAQQLDEASRDNLPQPAATVTLLDLGSVARNSVRSARAATGTEGVRLEPHGTPLPIRCDGFGLERAILHVLITALHHSRGDGSVVVRLGRSAGAGIPAPPGEQEVATARLEIDAEDSRVPTGELARVVSRFAGVACDEEREDPSGPAAIRIARGTVTVDSGSVHAQAQRDGRLVLTARWPLDNHAEDVIHR